MGAPIDLGVRVLNTFITCRTGTRSGEGTITGVFTVLLEGDDHNEPIADAVRAVLDGHIVMERAIAERGRYPSINVLKSVSRSMPRSTAPAYLEVLARARKVMATYSDMEELIRLGAYRPGSSPEVTKPSGSTRRLRPFWPRTRPNPRACSSGISGSPRSFRPRHQPAVWKPCQIIGLTLGHRKIRFLTLAPALETEN